MKVTVNIFIIPGVLYATISGMVWTVYQVLVLHPVTWFMVTFFDPKKSLSPHTTLHLLNRIQPIL
jgi:hypothetical protein